MRPISYVRPDGFAAVLAAGAAADAAFIAGGTNLVDLMKADVARPATIVDVTHLPLTDVAMRKDHLVLGALARMSDVANDATVRARFPLLSEALLAGASAQLRNMATIGGNLMQRTRCTYFYDTSFACNRREPGTGCAAQNGYNRGHAVLGTSEHCVATHPSDLAVALAALDADVVVMGRGARVRRIKVREFHLLPGDTPEKETALAHGELITAVEIPALPVRHGGRYVKIRDRASYEFALASAAAVIVRDGSKIREARLALGGVGTKPWVVAEAEAALVGQEASEATFARAADLAMAGARPLRHNEFKVELGKRAALQALRLASSAAVEG